MIVPASRFEQVAAAIAASTPPPPAPVNIANALHLNDEEWLEFRGLRWKVEPISGPEGLRLLELSGAIQAAQQANDIRALRRAHYVATAFMWRLVKRGRWWTRLLPTRNPLRRATFQEISSLLFFFAHRQMTSTVRFRFMKDAPPLSTTRN